MDGSGNAYLTGRASSADFPRVNQISGACASELACFVFSQPRSMLLAALWSIPAARR